MIGPELLEWVQVLIRKPNFLERYDVPIPDPATQHEKNPRLKRVEETVTYTDPLTGEERTTTITRLVYETTVDPETGEERAVMGGEPDWGLGCPAGCGWHITLTADSVLEHLQPKHPELAWQLLWKPGSYPNRRVLRCPRCGACIRLVRG
jgi:hypothetical protein